MTPSRRNIKIAMKDILYLAQTVFMAILLRKRIPLIVSRKLTNRCNYKCCYCGYWHSEPSVSELTTEQVFKVIDQLSSAGVRRIGFTGGEPLIRDDFGDILEHCFQRGISIGINTNGSLIKKHAQKLDRIKTINLSLDGPEYVNDPIRGKGAFVNVMQAIEFARAKGIDNIELTTVLSKANVGSIEYLLDLAESLKVRIIFQPATQIILGGNNNNPLALSVSELRKAVSTILKEKRFNKYIGNSISGLRFLLKYPTFQSVRCARGVLAARIDADGELYICDRNTHFGNRQGKNILKLGFNKAWADLEPPICRSGCGCAKVVELNLALSLNLNAIMNALRLY